MLGLRRSDIDVLCIIGFNKYLVSFLYVHMYDSFGVWESKKAGSGTVTPYRKRTAKLTGKYASRRLRPAQNSAKVCIDAAAEVLIQSKIWFARIMVED